MKVAIGLVFDAQRRVLVTQRAWEKSHGGYWEFPGGKLEEGEDPQIALSREMAEELGIEVTSARFWQELVYDYPDYQVHLLAFEILAFIGTPRCCEDQLDLRWLSAQELPDYAFPAANLPLVQALIG